MNEKNESPVMAYLDDLVVSSVIRNRVLEIEEFYTALLQGSVAERIFVSETVDSEGQRIFESLWFFFAEAWCEAHNFQVEDKFDVVRIERISYAITERHEYKTGKATTKSRLSLNFKLSNTNLGQLKASGENCNALSLILQELIMPRVVTET